MKLTKSEKHWILYDVGNSAFIMMVSTIIPIYFNWLSENAGISSVDYLAFWGYAASIATLIVVLVGPIAGTVADYKNLKSLFLLLRLGLVRLDVLHLDLSVPGLAFWLFLSLQKLDLTPVSSSMIPCSLTSQTTKEWMRFHPLDLHGDISEAASHSYSA